ncbi:MAG: hypothetical protein IKE24_04475 [Clostridia bacterium]|nr:hypothetical protein [Clostridia bacterium]
MTNQDREIWRKAFVLYDNHHDMPNTFDAWNHYIQQLAAFAEANDWRRHPLTNALFNALVESVEGEIRNRERQPRQLFMPEVINF